MVVVVDVFAYIQLPW